mmetsp:Transcript_59785/g.166901  ORF Transcript_59785/g.166901 Transcript_59785/m.166901 type:complete len:527 (-) Transcript_59785:92-1672(-)
MLEHCRSETFAERLMALLGEYENLQAENQHLRSMLHAKQAGSGLGASHEDFDGVEVDTPRTGAKASDEDASRQAKDAGTNIARHPPTGSSISRGFPLGGHSLGAPRRTGCRHWVASLVMHSYFDAATSVVIVCNTVYMGWAADQEIRHSLSKQTSGAQGEAGAIEIAFTTFYTLELALKLYAFGSVLVLGRDRMWNIFDMVLVAQCLYEQVVSAIGKVGSGGGNMSFLRALRLLKMAKMLRMIRLVRSMRELRILLYAVLGSMKSMLWSLLLLLLVLFGFAVLFVQACSQYVAERDIPPEMLSDIKLYWSSVLEAMMTLWQASSGGVNWGGVARPLRHFGGGVFYWIFCFYILFFMFVILNTITSLFVEACLDNASRDTQAVIQSQMERKAKYAATLEVLFREMDADHDENVTMEEFRACLQNPHMVAFVESLGIEIGDAEYCFRLLSGEGHCGVDVDSFVEGCIKMKGDAQSIDMQDALLRLKQTSTNLDEIRASLLGMRAAMQEFVGRATTTSGRVGARGKFDL